MRNHRGQKGSEKHGSVQEQEEGESRQRRRAREEHQEKWLRIKKYSIELERKDN